MAFPPRRIASWKGALAALLVACASIAAVPRPAVAAQTNNEIIFNRPNTGTMYAIEDRLVTLIDQATTGTSLKMAMYQMRDRSGGNNVKDALIRAKNRGVNVQLLLDATALKTSTGADEGAYADLKASLGANVKFCGAIGSDKGCHGALDMHNKFVLFSSLTDGTTNIIFQTSQNANSWAGGYLQHNNAVILKNENNTALWNGYTKYFNDMWGVAAAGQSNTNDNYWNVQKVVNGSYGDAQFMPRTYTSGKSLADILDQVDCPGSVIRTTQFQISDEIMINALRRAKSRGCDTWVVTNRRSSVPALNATATTTESPMNGSMRFYETRDVTDTRLGTTSNNDVIHSKYTIITGAINATVDGILYNQDKFVFTGSANFTAGSRVSADETILRLQSMPGLNMDAVYSAYFTDFDFLWDGGRPSTEY
ncbi:phospholipase D-like domain-containing protein [Actinocorallia sp. B10E7]|uniref:phospholipase D-like domain-containing protein n=1 Tax=Actinocorallia sp. B10E7 TaxID=3153558 RepID=UPI00325E061D